MAAPLVVGTDGSADALRAVDWATEEAALRRCPLRLVYASLWARYEVPALSAGGPRRARRTGAARSIAAAAEERARARRPGVAVTAEVCDEDPVYALLDASDGAAALIVGPARAATRACQPCGAALCALHRRCRSRRPKGRLTPSSRHG